MKFLKYIITKIKNQKIRLQELLFFYRFKIRKSKVLVSFDKLWFQEKRVAIIGGADSVLQEPLGAYIDSFDVVVRINNGVKIIEDQHRFVGLKTDFLFHTFYSEAGSKESSPIEISLWAKNKVGRIIFARHEDLDKFSIRNANHFMDVTGDKCVFSQVPKNESKKEFAILSPFTPTTGFTAINVIMSCHPKELYLTGITFFKTAHNLKYRAFEKEDMNRVFQVKGLHSPEGEYQHVKKLYLKNPNIIKPDKILKAIFDNN